MKMLNHGWGRILGVRSAEWGLRLETGNLGAMTEDGRRTNYANLKRMRKQATRRRKRRKKEVHVGMIAEPTLPGCIAHQVAVQHELIHRCGGAKSISHDGLACNQQAPSVGF